MASERRVLPPVVPVKTAGDMLREGFAIKAPGPDQFRCSACGGVFDKGRTDEAAMAEAEQIFGEELHAGGLAPAVVCEDCYRSIMGPLQ